MAELLGASGGPEVDVQQVQRRGFDAASTILEYAEESGTDRGRPALDSGGGG